MLLLFLRLCFYLESFVILIQGGISATNPLILQAQLFPHQPALLPESVAIRWFSTLFIVIGLTELLTLLKNNKDFLFIVLSALLVGDLCQLAIIPQLINAGAQPLLTASLFYPAVSLIFIRFIWFLHYYKYYD